MNINLTNYFNCTFDSGNGEINQDFFTERDFLGGWTVSERHPISGLKRRASTEILPKNKIYNYKPIMLKEILNNVLLKYATDQNVIFLSGGKDSTALAHAMKELDIPFTAVSLYSDISPTTEKHIVNQVANQLGITIKFYKIDKIPKKHFEYWVENPYTAKVQALKDLKLDKHTIFTGEIGTGEMQVNQSLQYTAMMGYKPKELSYWHVNVCGSYRRYNSIVPMYKDSIYEECVEHFIKRFEQWDRHPDVLNRVMFSRLQDEGAYRLFNYGLDNIKWVHPFADDLFIETCVNISSEHKGKKNLYREMYENLTDIPWRYPKSGLGIRLCNIQNLIVLANKNAKQAFIETVYPHNIDCIVLTKDEAKEWTGNYKVMFFGCFVEELKDCENIIMDEFIFKTWLPKPIALDGSLKVWQCL